MQFIDQKDVNLINFVPHTKAPFPRLSHILMTVIVVFLLAAALLINPLIKERQLRQAVEQQKRVNVIKSTALENDISTMDKGKGRYVATLNAPTRQDAVGFSSQLVALASKPLNGVWLTDIHIDRLSHHVSVSGSSFLSSGFYHFLDFLNHCPSFQVSHFQ